MKKQMLSTNSFTTFENYELKDSDLTQIKGGIVIEEEIIG